MISVSDPNPVVVEIILSRSENYPKMYYETQHTLLCCVYAVCCVDFCTLLGKITAVVILPLAEHEWLK